MDSQAIERHLRKTCWAIHQPALEAALARYQAGAPPLPIDAARVAPTKGSAIGVIPIMGVIRQRGPEDFMDALFGGVGASTDKIAAGLRAFAADPEVGTIVLNIDSPGGTVYGVEELADEVYNTAKQKPVIAVANSMAFSAAYWIASQATEVVVTPSGEVGSIGVWMLHADFSEMDKRIGVDFTYISAGKYKVAANEDEPLSDEARGLLQADVDRYYAAFVSAVARGRSVRTSEVRGGFGEGWIVGAKEAVQLGMADKAATFSDTLRRFGVKSAPTNARAEVEIARERLNLRERV